jgi:hypothetical protein
MFLRERLLKLCMFETISGLYSSCVDSEGRLRRPNRDWQGVPGIAQALSMWVFHLVVGLMVDLSLDLWLHSFAPESCQGDVSASQNWRNLVVSFLQQSLQ